MPIAHLRESHSNANVKIRHINANKIRYSKSKNEFKMSLMRAKNNQNFKGASIKFKDSSE